ncbi:MAG TPA: MFS transporter [Beijerinckiaceae bacterium]|nr:MFS transporter [Beijerinckiaceae bacterium]
MLAKGIEILDCASERAGDAAAPRWPAVLSLYGIVLLAGFGGSYAIQFLNLGLQQRGVSGSAIGLSTATQALGIVIAACVAVPVLNRLGSARTLALGSLIAGFALAAAALVESIEAVTMARFVCALGIGTLVTNVEYVVIARMPVERRATAVAVYATVFAVGTALAPATIALLGCDGMPARLLGGASFFLAALLVLSAEVRGRIDARPAARPSLRTIGLAPLAFVAALMFGALDNGLLSLIAVFAVETGHSSVDASALAAAGFLGVVLFQIPAGYCADRYSPQTMLTVCSATALLCIIGLLTATGTRTLLFPLMVLLGGACDGFYTLGLAVMSRSVPRQQLAAGNACFVALCGAGEIAGPLLAGGGTALAGPGGLIGAFAVLLLAYCVVLFRDAGPRLVPAPAHAI